MKYREISIGDKHILQHTITKRDIEKFVDLTGDDNRLHVDEAFAKKTSFKKPVVHGMLGASFISTIIGTKIPGDGALWFSQTLEFLLPVRVGDALTITAEVIKKNDKEEIIELKTEILNQNRQIVTKGFSKVKVVALNENEEVQVDSIRERSVKTILVIGATGGIGSATCLQLAKEGYSIAIHYNRNSSLAEELKTKILAHGGRAITVGANILNIREIKELIFKVNRKFGSIDAMVNAAAISIPTIKFQDLVWEDYLHQFEINIKATFILIKEVSTAMISNGYGKIVNISSISVEKPNSDWSHYITAKSALVGLTKSLAFELAPKGIRINIITPSLINTELTADIPEKVKLLSAAQTPLRRLAQPEDIAGAISFLISPKSDFMTGENLRINGGQIML